MISVLGYRPGERQVPNSTLAEAQARDILGIGSDVPLSGDLICDAYLEAVLKYDVDDPQSSTMLSIASDAYSCLRRVFDDSLRVR